MIKSTNVININTFHCKYTTVKYIIFDKILDYLSSNKEENVHRFALSAIRGELLERGREKERERSTQFEEGSINGPSNRERVGLTLKLD